MERRKEKRRRQRKITKVGIDSIIAAVSTPVHCKSVLVGHIVKLRISAPTCVIKPRVTEVKAIFGRISDRLVKPV